MSRTLKRSSIAFFCAFVLFGLAWLGFTRLEDPLPPWLALVHLHPEVGVTFQVLLFSGATAFLMFLVSGLPIVLSVIKQAWLERRREILLLIGGTALVIITFSIFTAFVVLGAINGATPVGILYGVCALLGLLAVVIFLVLAIVCSQPSTRAMRFALIPASILTLAMGTAFVATLIEASLLSSEAPAMFASNGVLNWVVADVVMAGAFVWASIALWGGLRTRTHFAH